MGITKVSFSAYFSENPHLINNTKVSRNVLLPLLSDDINSSAMVRHCMLYAQRITQHLNNDQHVVIIADQPVYALGKQVQWFYPVNFKNCACAKLM